METKNSKKGNKMFNYIFDRNFTLFKLIVALIAGLITTTHLDADLFDKSFSIDGLAVLDEHVQDRFEQFVVAPDGSIFVVGSTYANHAEKWNVLIAKYDSTGQLDPSFGGDGTVELDIRHKNDEPIAISLQDDGKVVVLSRAGIYTYLSRYHAYGAPDETFANLTSGHVINLPEITPNPPGDGPFSAPGFIAKGMTKWGNRMAVYSHEGAVAVYEEDGTIDENFGHLGVAWTTLSFASRLSIEDILMRDNKIYLFGMAYEDGLPSVPAIYAMNADGTPFLEFGDGGVLVLPNDAMQETKSFVYNNGLFTMGGGNRIVQMDDNGILAGNLSINGVVDLPDGTEVTDVVLQPLGRIAASVKMPDDEDGYESNKFSIVRLLSDGVADHNFSFSTFGFESEGWFEMTYEEVTTAKQLFSYANGKLLAAGDFKQITGNESVLLLRLNSTDSAPTRGVQGGPGGFQGLTTGSGR